MGLHGAGFDFKLYHKFFKEKQGIIIITCSTLSCVKICLWLNIVNVYLCLKLNTAYSPATQPLSNVFVTRFQLWQGCFPYIFLHFCIFTFALICSVFFSCHSDGFVLSLS